MDITRLLDGLRRDLGAAAEAAGPEGRVAAERMLSALEPAFLLTLLEALSHATAEITAELPVGVVEIRMRGREPEIVVDVPSSGPSSTPSTPPPPRPPRPPEPYENDDEAGEDSVARVTLRLPESVKSRAEDLAARSGHSLNGWIVGVLRAATSRGAVEVDLDLSSIPFRDVHSLPHGARDGRRMTGWA